MTAVSAASPAPAVNGPVPESGRRTASPPPATGRVLAVIGRRFGGEPGRHARVRASRLNATVVVLITATAVWILGAVQQIPCRITTAGNYPNSYAQMCYSDIPLLYRDRGLVVGNIPYLGHGHYPPLEYPVLTGWLLEFQRRITVLLGAPSGPGLSEQHQIDAASIFTAVNLVVLGGLFLLTVWAHAAIGRSGGGHPDRRWDAIMLAVSPCVALAGFINWDLLPIACTALGVLFWARRRPGWAGAMLGLGMAAKLYPVLLLGPLFLLCLRSRKLRQFRSALIGFVIAWLVPNLPVMIMAPQQWLAFWSFNSDRGADLGSIWYVLSLAGHPVPHLNAVSTILLLALCAAIGVMIIGAPQRPRFGQVAYLVVLAFVITSKVYSPQYALWLLPLLILARPRWREWAIFTAGEVIYFGAIWTHLNQTQGATGGGPDRLYWLAVIIRICCELWVAIMVLRDIYRPDRCDPLRKVVDSGPSTGSGRVIYGPVADDPAGGVLDGAADARWVSRLRRLFGTGAPP